MTDSTDTVPPSTMRRLETPDADVLGALEAVLQDLQTALRCCEWLMDRNSTVTGDPVVVEAVWTTALLSYGRCFGAPTGAALTDADLTATQPHGDVMAWHRALLVLRDHYADVATNPRESFTVGVVQDADGVAGALAVTSARQPTVDVLTVKQTGAIAFALTALVTSRIEARQADVLAEARTRTRADLDALASVEVSRA